MALPHWDLSNVFPGLDSQELKAATQNASAQLDALEQYMDSNGFVAGKPAPADVGRVLSGYIDRRNALEVLLDTIDAYLLSFTRTDSYNQVAARLESEFRMVRSRMAKLDIRFDTWLRAMANAQPPVWSHDGSAKAHSFFLRETIEQSRYLMSEPEESLAADLNLSGLFAWQKLQGTVTSQLTVPFVVNGATETLPMPALQNLQREADPDLRRRAYEAEVAAWASVREPVAAAMNGLKGAVATLNKHRGRTDALHQSLDQARIDRETLDAMMGAMTDSFPAFRSYLKAKAKRLGYEGGLRWWDIFAPVVGQASRKYSWEETREFLVTQFGTFSPRLAGFAARAFDRNWIDAEPRAGKRGGAFCMGVLGVEEPRILCNFDGSLDQVFTVAHELGHGYHFTLMHGKTPIQRNTPMTLNETASIFCETLVTDAAIRESKSAEDELAIIETFLQGTTQVIVDISSRFLFEREVFERRVQSELSADDFCDIMTRAQKATFGDGLDERTLHPYMWAWKPHYYRPDLQFYNFPYAFGLLFGLGLFAIYQQRGAAFVSDYEALLASTGEDTAANLAARFGIDIRSRAFWQNSLNVIAARIERYNQL